ncbi:type II toxin-antitoxin system Phd/YefM family antitoxin [Burkholderia stagnalis]|uniref:Antitoxin n=1 Tax=Burkholderia stagnalis TaxID=1503054 RepID=A0ABX9YUE1_9BURK|nr:type II toxin-antitoxin system prevent-host-death family antitoxin [Burkholderia stagnalis]RQQ63628.1 type II toxin-antitoxin system prevent-host-death family antitoxin [Burkholderia stagnalis]RQQ70582.1 type II toxin-antitoxin system prevent-host-death family antitoxin [Burkholderia stagnalis]RQQ71670.1 type II toxin-antitoxin system prevent-host-death family antitoxin [Burkholderia stagnalis]RQQ83851.1 type II toxin-antitoxin system prevent-host-death family antitoxin [Burkholderia stagnal
MQTYNMHEAKTNLSRLIDEAVHAGEPFVIAKAGKPLVKVVPIDTREPAPPSRIGFMKGQIRVPDDFDSMGGDDIRKLFEGDA